MDNNRVLFKCSLSDPSSLFGHFWEHTVGASHATMALRADWQKQLIRCSKDLGFKHVRFHGALSDDMYTVNNENDQIIYSFFNIDQICDFLLSINVRPFFELSFMPSALSSGNDTVFSYKGNVTPPKDYDAWGALVSKLVTHLVKRYGLEEVRRWFFEVWNEPNLDAFWKGQKTDYFKLYQYTAAAIKTVDAALCVGGPATANNEWVTDFISFCQSNNVPIDFISTHHYPTDSFGKPGDDTVTQLSESKRSILREEAHKVNEQAQGIPVYYTEWSTSSNPFDTLHDQSYAAAFIIKTVIEVRGFVKGYSYWTFSDIFDENYFSSKPFHGGFGLMNIYGIPKPAYRAYELLHRLGNEILEVDGQHSTVDVWVTRNKNEIKIMVTNWALPRHKITTQQVTIRLGGINELKNVFIERIDESHANAQDVWQKMDASDSLTPIQVLKLEAASELSSERCDAKHENDELIIEFSIPEQGVACLTVQL